MDKKHLDRAILKFLKKKLVGAFWRVFHLHFFRTADRPTDPLCHYLRHPNAGFNDVDFIVAYINEYDAEIDVKAVKNRDAYCIRRRF